MVDMTEPITQTEDTRPLRVAHIGTERGWRGGENQALTLACGLRDRGHDCLIIAQPDSGLSRRARDRDFRVEEVRMLGEWDAVAWLRVRSVVRSFDADVVHTHTSHAHAIGLAAVAHKTVNARLVVSRRVDFAISDNAWAKRKYLSSRCNYIAISSGVRDVLVDGGVAPERVHIVHSGVDPERFTYDRSGLQFRLEMGWAPGDILVGNVGALTDHKDHITFLEAAAKVLEVKPNARFCIVGQGELKGLLAAKGQQLKLGGRFRLAGYHEDIEECFAGFDLFALSSHLEGLCTSLIDAMLLEVPVIATDTGGVPDLVKHEETGLLVPPKDPDALAAGILRLIDDEALAKSLATQAKRFAMAGFTNEQMVAGTEQAYRNIISRQD